MERNLKNKNVVITGGSKGIGLSIAEKFLENDAKTVILLDLDDKVGTVAANDLNNKGKGRAVFIKCDVTTDLDKVFNKIITKYKNIDVLVNNAGWVKEDSIRDTLEVNLIAVVEGSTKFIEHMGRDAGGNGGTIINVSSIFGFQSSKLSPFYAASKHAVLGFTKSKGHEDTFAETAVRMIALCPGFTKTHLLDDAVLPGGAEKIEECMKSYEWQEASAVGEAAVEIFEKADSGTAWLIEGGHPVTQVFQ